MFMIAIGLENIHEHDQVVLDPPTEADLFSQVSPQTQVMHPHDQCPENPTSVLKELALPR